MTADEEAVHALIDGLDADSRLVHIIDAFYSGATYAELDPPVTSREFEDAVRAAGIGLPGFPDIYRSLLALKNANTGIIKGEL